MWLIPLALAIGIFVLIFKVKVQNMAREISRECVETTEILVYNQVIAKFEGYCQKGYTCLHFFAKHKSFKEVITLEPYDQVIFDFVEDPDGRWYETSSYLRINKVIKYQVPTTQGRG